jgi:hypothetical protein
MNLWQNAVLLFCLWRVAGAKGPKPPPAPADALATFGDERTQRIATQRVLTLAARNELWPSRFLARLHEANHKTLVIERLKPHVGQRVLIADLEEMARHSAQSDDPRARWIAVMRRVGVRGWPVLLAFVAQQPTGGYAQFALHAIAHFVGVIPDVDLLEAARQDNPYLRTGVMRAMAKMNLSPEQQTEYWRLVSAARLPREENFSPLQTAANLCRTNYGEAGRLALDYCAEHSTQPHLREAAETALGMVIA